MLNSFPGGTQSADFVFAPKVWKDHIQAYFDKKLVHGAFAQRDNSLQSAPGMTVTMPYFKNIGAAEEPAENASLTVDKLGDDSFSATVKEVGKAVGIVKKAFKKSGAQSERIISEIQQQIARVMAEKVDADLLAEVNDAANHTVGFDAAADADTMNIRRLNSAITAGFGDKSNDAVVVIMHSLQLLDLQNDSTAGFLQANANDPLYGLQGFAGRLLGKAVVVADNVPEIAPAGAITKKRYSCFVHKMNPYGLITKQDMELESDYDILHREWIFTGNQWYAVKSYHGKVNSLDKRTLRVTTTNSVA